MQADHMPPVQCKTVGSPSHLTSSKSRDQMFFLELAEQTRAKLFLDLHLTGSKRGFLREAHVAAFLMDV